MSDSTPEDMNGPTYEYAEYDTRLEEQGVPMLNSRHPTMDELSRWLGVETTDLVVLAMAGRFRGEDVEDDPHLAAACARELQEIVDDLTETADRLATDRLDEVEADGE